MDPRVSLVVPCYNGERFIDDFMKAVMELEYDNIQLIITDDGSKDNSYIKLESFRSCLVDKGIDYILLHKENGGQPSAFNMGIKKADGKYVAWPDIDDKMHKDFLQKKVEYMEDNPEVDFLISKSAIVPLANKSKVVGYTWPNRITDNQALIDRVLKDYDCWFEPGAYFARLSSLDRYIKDRTIYDLCGTWSGPQIQIVLPFFYFGKIGYLDECLYDYYIHDAQHHSKLKSKESLKRKNEEVKKMLEETVRRLEAPNEKELMQIIDERIIRSESLYAFQINDRVWFQEAYSKFDKKMITWKDRMRLLIAKNSLMNYLFSIYKKSNQSPLG